MKEHFRVFLVLAGALAALGLAMTGCDLGGDGATNKITGVVRDSVSGDPVAAVTVTFGSSSATTGADGSFSLDLGASSGVVIGSWSTSASGYSFDYWEEVVVDTNQTGDLQVHIQRLGVDTTYGSYTDLGYSTRKIDLTVEDSGGIEIPTGWELNGEVMNSNGGMGHFQFSYTNGGPNTFDNPTFGSDCLVVAAVEDNTGTPQFVVMARQVDLSASTTPLNLTATAGTSVDITADAIGNMGMLTLRTPYGPVEVQEWMFTSSTLISGAKVYNPYGYEGLWAQMMLDTTDPNYEKLLFSTSAISSIGTSVTLPSLDDTLGPDAGYGGFSVSYSASTGVLSFPPVSGASFYLVSILEPAVALGGYYRPAQFYLASESITLPQWLRTDLAGVTADVYVTAADFGSSTAYLSEIFQGFPPDMKCGFALEKGGTDPDEGHLEAGVVF